MELCLFVGSKKLGLNCLTLLINSFPGTVCGAVTIDDTADARSVHSEFSRLADQKNIPLHILSQTDNLGSYLEHYKPDLVFVCGWYRLIAAELLQIPRHGFVGIHNSLLPRYRGGAPLVWAIINGETEAGFSLFQFTPSMDDGPLFAQHAVPIHDEDTISDVLKRVETAVPKVLREIYISILTGALVPKAQIGCPSYASQRVPEDGKIQWTAPQNQVYNFIRAQCSPYPGAFSIFDGKRIVFERVTKLPLLYYGTPGQIVFGEEGSPWIICGDNKPLKINAVRIDGNSVPSRSILSSLQIRLGT
jgi:methionyl-tRNA formyltransferase